MGGAGANEVSGVLEEASCCRCGAPHHIKKRMTLFSHPLHFPNPRRLPSATPVVLVFLSGLTLLVHDNGAFCGRYAVFARPVHDLAAKMDGRAAVSARSRVAVTDVRARWGCSRAKSSLPGQRGKRTGGQADKTCGRERRASEQDYREVKTGQANGIAGR